MSENKTILLKVTLDVADLEKKANLASENLAALVDKQKLLKSSAQTLTPEYSKLSTEIKIQKKELDTISGAIVKYEKLNKSNTGSVVDQRLALEAGTVAFNNLTKEQLENVEVGGKLAKENLALKESINGQQEALGNFVGSVGNYSKGLTELKAELKNLKGEMVGLDAGSKQYQEASEKAGKLGDKIKEVNENVKASSGGTGFEKLSNNLGLVQDDLMNMDFQGVSEKMKQMAIVSKSMTFTEVLGGLKSLGSGLISLGKAILMNPLFMIVGAVVAIVGALKMWSDSVDKDAIKAQERLTASMNKQTEASKRQLEDLKFANELRLRLAKARGKSEDELNVIENDNAEKERKKGLKVLQDLNKERLKEREIYKKASAVILESQNISNADIYSKGALIVKGLIVKSDVEKAGIQIEGAKKRLKEKDDEYKALFRQLKESKQESKVIEVEDESERNDRIKENRAKAIEDQKRFNEERLNLERQLKDLILGNEKLSNENQLSVLDATFEARKIGYEGNAEELLKIEGEKNEALSKLNSEILKDNLTSLTESHEREVEDAKGNKKIILELNKKFELEKAGLISDAKNSEDLQNKSHLKSVENLNKQKIESERKTANEIKILDAELQLAKSKGLSTEFEAWTNLRDAKIAVLKDNAKTELEIETLTANQKLEVEKKLSLDVQNLNNEQFETVKKVEVEKTSFIDQENLNKINSGVGAGQQLADALVQIKQNQTSQELIDEQNKFDTKSKLLQDQLDAGLISNAEYNAMKSSNDAEYHKKESELKAEQFKRNKQQAIINATIATALAVVNALATPPPASFVLAGIAGVLGAVNIATIVSQPTPKFSRGGLAKQGVFGGQSHNNGGTKGVFSDGTNIEVEKDEAFFILNKKSSSMISKLSAINEIGGGVPLMKNGGVLNFATGGVLGSSVSSEIDSRASLRNEMIEAFKFLPNPVVSVEDINTGQSNKIFVSERANF